MLRLPILCASLLALSACAATTPDGGDRAAAMAEQARHESALRAAVAAPGRSAEHRARDQYRRPYESLTFWGLKPGMTVVEIDPGSESWWSEILQPYLNATGGRFVAGYVDLGNPNVTEGARKARADFVAKYPGAQVVNFGMTSGLGMPDGSADMILVARSFHNWARREGMTDRYMAEFARALKPGGVLAVEQHRLKAGSPARPESGYVTEQYVIDAAVKAGLQLDGRSEINANPKDDTDHPFGVWTLPPIRRSSAQGQPADPSFDRAAYDAIGESDRMTLRFRKPG